MNPASRPRRFLSCPLPSAPDRFDARLPRLARPTWVSCTASLAVLILSLSARALGAEFYVSPTGNDANPGTPERPVATLTRAQEAARVHARQEPITVTLRDGTYYLPETLVFKPEDSGTPEAPVVYRAAPGEQVILSGGQRLALSWSLLTNGLWQATPPDLGTTAPSDQLFVNGVRQILARYPNYDPAIRPYGGFAADAFSRDRAARWADPTGGFIHAMHRAHWGGYHYRITGKDGNGEITYEGGWQNNRQMGMHPEHRYVENILEELDASGEWFLDHRSGTLSFYPPPGLDLTAATVEIVRLRHLIEFRGAPEQPVKHLTLQGFTFRHAGRTFMDTREPLLRSDWTIYRGGAVLLEGTENCTIQDCTFDQVGGNSVFVNLYNRRVAIRGCLIRDSGGNGVCFVGDPLAVRNPLFEYGQRQDLADISLAPGPQTDNYPADCLVEDCLITRIGRVEKQAAAVQISMAQGITVRHCSIYEVPRAGINISEGTWGGHLIEGCDVFDTVLETGDHGSFNSWGRDRYWGLRGVDLNTVTRSEHHNLPLLDAVEPTILRNNRWRCDHGWDIDLDDGSSNYEIRNNLCLNGGIKLREGFYRVCENNIMVNNSFHPHVWYRNSQDVFRHNLVFAPYRPIRVDRPWGQECDFNLLHTPGQSTPQPARELEQQSGRDEHSLAADARFINPANGDYRVRPDSTALELGFESFAMDQFGVRKAALRAIARTPEMPGTHPAAATAPTAEPSLSWEGATLRNLVGEEYSALGIAQDARGALVAEVVEGSRAAHFGLRPNDFVLAVNGQSIPNARGVVAALKALADGGAGTIEVIRAQQREVLRIDADSSPAVLQRSTWQGFERLDFEVSGRPGLLVLPQSPAPGRPWIWRTEFFGHEPQADVALLAKGFHVAYLDVQNLYGAPVALDAMDQFHSQLTTRFGLSPKVVLEGFSRGGLFAFNWAARHPELTAALYVDAPVCDFKSWPAGWGQGPGSPEDWSRCKAVYGFDDDQARAYPLNPVDNLAPLARAKIPILSVCGDADEAVPFVENTGLVYERYTALGGPMTVLVKPDVGHHPHSLKQPARIVDFILRTIDPAPLAPGEMTGLERLPESENSHPSP